MKFDILTFYMIYIKCTICCTLNLIAKYFKNIGSYNRVNIIMQLALFYFLYINS